jgi:hypothetical protein
LEQDRLAGLEERHQENNPAGERSNSLGLVLEFHNDCPVCSAIPLI